MPPARKLSRAIMFRFDALLLLIIFIPCFITFIICKVLAEIYYWTMFILIYKTVGISLDILDMDMPEETLQTILKIVADPADYLDNHADKELAIVESASNKLWKKYPEYKPED